MNKSEREKLVYDRVVIIFFIVWVSILALFVYFITGDSNENYSKNIGHDPCCWHDFSIHNAKCGLDIKRISRHGFKTTVPNETPQG